MIFLDNASTTQVCDKAIKAAQWAASEGYFNPSALYGEALKVKNAIEEARSKIASLLGCEGRELFFTSCATESNNWAYERGIRSKKGNIVISSAEHASGYECALAQKNKGLDVRFIKLDRDGTINESDLMRAIDEDTCFASIIHVSNETGAINDIAKLTKLIKEVNPRTIVHSDGVQAFCKRKISVAELGVDLYSVSAHKVGGFKGVGALYVRNGKIAPFIVGGGQEKGLRSGTENVAGILGFGEAAVNYKSLYDKEKVAAMRQCVIDELKDVNVIINGNGCEAILSLSIEGIKAEVLCHMLSDHGVLIGLGSACSSRARSNRTLSAIGRSAKEIEGSIRISFGINNDIEQVKYASKIIKEQIITLRGNIK